MLVFVSSPGAAIRNVQLSMVSFYPWWRLSCKCFRRIPPNDSLQRAARAQQLMRAIGRLRRTEMNEIGQIAVTVSDVAKVLPFYRDALGLKFLFSPSPDLAFLSVGSVRIMLSTPQGSGKVGANSILYFKVKNIVAAYAEVVARGATAERPPQLTAKLPNHELWIGFLRDPDGNLVGLMEEKC
jgi:predicted enzyme related to lactoylglutathione lyase